MAVEILPGFYADSIDPQLSTLVNFAAHAVAAGADDTQNLSIALQPTRNNGLIVIDSFAVDLQPVDALGNLTVQHITCSYAGPSFAKSFIRGAQVQVPPQNTFAKLAGGPGGLSYVFSFFQPMRSALVAVPGETDSIFLDITMRNADGANPHSYTVTAVTLWRAGYGVRF